MRREAPPCLMIAIGRTTVVGGVELAALLRFGFTATTMATAFRFRGDRSRPLPSLPAIRWSACC